MMDTLKHLHSPALVANIQNIFGLYREVETSPSTTQHTNLSVNASYGGSGVALNDADVQSSGSLPGETTLDLRQRKSITTTTSSEPEIDLIEQVTTELTKTNGINGGVSQKHSSPSTRIAPKGSDGSHEDSSIASGLMSSGLEAHGIFSVRVASTTKTKTTAQIAATPCSSGDELEDEGERTDYRVTSQFWHIFFSLASNLGNEVFYCSFFPFWFWNVDTYVARRVITLWALNMYIGQALKDLIRWPRPSAPPVVRLEDRYALEYGMPSTHAMVGVAIPFGLLITSLHRYNLIMWLSVGIAVLWTSSICASRLYLGMHSVLDVIVGILLTVFIMMIFLPMADSVDWFCLTHPLSPLMVLSGTLFAAVMYPSLDRWSTARGDTTTVIGTNAGVMVGSWLNYYLGYLKPAMDGPPYEIIYPSFHDIGLSLLRTCIGILILLATRAIVKLTVFWGLKLTFTIDDKSKESLKVEIPYKFLPYATMGLMAIFFCPIAFDILNIARITSYTEM